MPITMPLQETHRSRPLQPGPRQRGRPKVMSDAAQCALIIERARTLFLENSYGSTTTDDIAARCRISKQTLYRLFPSKQALFTAIVDAHRQNMLVMPDGDDLPLQAALEQIFRIDIDPKADAERMAFLHFVMVEAQRSPELRDIVLHHGAARSHTELTRWLAGQKRRRLIDVDDVGSAARILMDMIFGTIMARPIHSKKKLSAASRRMHISRCIRIFLDGVETARK